MEKCSVCKEMTRGKYWCDSCHAVFVCPAPRCEAPNHRRDAKVCAKCGLIFADYITHRKMYRMCPKCKKKQGLSDPQCKYCRYWFNCPTCGHKVPSTSMFTCPRCGTSLR
jgi:hypothetical protein